MSTIMVYTEIKQLVQYMKGIELIHSSLFELMFLIQIEMKKVVKNSDTNLSPIEILLLRSLSEHGEVSQQQLAEQLSKDKAQITRLIQQLEKKQLITKYRNPQDKRSYIVKANNIVKEKMVGLIEYENNLVKLMLDGASEKEIQSMENLLQLMKNNLNSCK